MDETKLTPANENRWYLLMTLYGEQEGEWIFGAFHEKNRAVWNAWACQDLSEEARAKLEADGVALPAVGAWEEMKEEVARLHKAAFETRGGAAAAYRGLPDVAARVDLSGVVFANRVKLERLIFSAEAFFLSATFSAGADFRSATFSAGANFRFAKFSAYAEFNSATFSARALFRSATFSGDAYFREASFSAGADFNSATFSAFARFGSAKFSAFADFESATFCATADFMFATFSAAASFRSATFHAPARFVETRFGNPEAPEPALLNLTDAQFEKPASFREAVFLNRYPDFTGTIMPAQTLFPWEPENWPAACDQAPKDGRDSCAVLRHHLGKQGLPEAESFFYRREMGFARRIGSFPARLPYLIYGWVSEYGYSIARPANLLLALWLLGAFCYSEWGAFGGFEALGYSFANMFKFFGLHRTYFDFEVIRAWPAWVQFVSGTQTVLAFILLFFLGLGLRTRFRLR